MLRVTLICGSFGDGHCGVGDYSFALARQLSKLVNLTVIGPTEFLKINQYQTSKNIDIETPTTFMDLQPFFTNGESVKIDQIKQWIKQNPDFILSSSNLSEGTFSFIPVDSYSLLRLGHLTKLIKQTRPDIVHIQYPAKGYKRSIGIEFLPLRFDSMVESSKLVATIHEFSSAHWLRKAAIYPMASLSHLVITSTKEMAKDLEYYGNSHVSIVPVGNNFEYEYPLSKVVSKKIEDIQTTESIPDSLFHFGFITKGKGLENLLYSMAIVRLQKPSIKLYLASDLNPSTPYHKRILDLIASLELAPWIEIIGAQPVSVLKSIAHKFSYQIFPFDDGMSDRRSSTISALELDCPIITTSKNQVYPLLSIQPKQPQLLADFIIEVLEKKSIEQRSALLYAQQMIKSSYSFSKIAKKHFELYNHIL